MADVNSGCSSSRSDFSLRTPLLPAIAGAEEEPATISEKKSAAGATSAADRTATADATSTTGVTATANLTPAWGRVSAGGILAAAAAADGTPAARVVAVARGSLRADLIVAAGDSAAARVTTARITAAGGRTSAKSVTAAATGAASASATAEIAAATGIRGGVLGASAAAGVGTETSIAIEGVPAAVEAAATFTEGEESSQKLRRRRWEAEQALLCSLIGMPYLSKADQRRSHNKNESSHVPTSRAARDSDDSAQWAISDSRERFNLLDHHTYKSNFVMMRKRERSNNSSLSVSHDICTSNSNCDSSDSFSSRQSSKVDSSDSSISRQGSKVEVGSRSRGILSRMCVRKNSSRWKARKRGEDNSSKCDHTCSVSCSFPISATVEGTITPFKLDESIQQEELCMKKRRGEDQDEGEEREEAEEEEGRQDEDKEEDNEKDKCSSLGKTSLANSHHKLCHNTALPSCNSSNICKKHAAISGSGEAFTLVEAVSSATCLKTAREGNLQQQRRQPNTGLPLFSTSSNTVDTICSREQVAAMLSPQNEVATGVPEAGGAALATRVRIQSHAPYLPTLNVTERRESTATTPEKSTPGKHMQDKAGGDEAVSSTSIETSQSAQLLPALYNDEEDAVLFDICRRWNISKHPAVSSNPKKRLLYSTRAASGKFFSQATSTLSPPSASLLLQKRFRVRQCFNFRAWRRALHKEGMYRQQQTFKARPALAIPAVAASPCGAATAAAAVHASDGGAPGWHPCAGDSDDSLARAIGVARLQTPSTTRLRKSVLFKPGATAEAVVLDIPPQEDHSQTERLKTATTAAPAETLATETHLTAPLAPVTAKLPSMTGPILSYTGGAPSVEGTTTSKVLSPGAPLSVQQKRDSSPDAVICLTDSDVGDDDALYVNDCTDMQRKGRYSVGISTKEQRMTSVAPLAEMTALASNHSDAEMVEAQLEDGGKTSKALETTLPAQDLNQEERAGEIDTQTALGASKCFPSAHTREACPQEAAVQRESSGILTVSRAKHQPAVGTRLQEGMQDVRAPLASRSVASEVEADEQEEGKVSTQSNGSRKPSRISHERRTRSFGWRRVGGEYDIWLILDVRERVTAHRSYTAIVESHTSSRGQYLFKQLQQNGVNVELRTLPVGDALWVARRKPHVQGEQRQLHLQHQEKKFERLQLQLAYCREQSHALGKSSEDEKVNISKRQDTPDSPDSLIAETAVGANAFAASAMQLLPDPAQNHEEKQKIPSLPTGTGETAAPCVLSSSSSSPVEFVLPFILERKTLRDLTASLRDGRYEEQKFRLLRCPGVKRIFFLIEGLLESSTYDAVPLLPLQKRHRSLLYGRLPAAVAGSGGAAASAEDTNHFRRRQQAFHARARALHHVHGVQSITQQERTLQAGNTQSTLSHQQLHRQEVLHASLASMEASRSLSSSAAAVASELAALRTAQVKTQLVSGFTVLQTTGPAHTVAMLTRLHRRLKIHFACAAAAKREHHICHGERDRLHQGTSTDIAEASQQPSRRCVPPPALSSALLVARVSAGFGKKTHRPSYTCATASKRQLATRTRQCFHREAGKGMHLSIKDTARMRIVDRIRHTEKRSRMREQKLHISDPSSLFLVSSDELGAKTHTNCTSCGTNSGTSKMSAFFLPGGSPWAGAHGGGALELLRWDIWRMRSGEAMNLSVKEIFCRQLCALPSMGQRGAAYIAETCCSPAAFATVLDSTTTEKQLREQLAATAAVIKEASLRKRLLGNHPRNAVTNNSSTPLSSQERRNEDGIEISANHQARVLTDTAFEAAPQGTNKIDFDFKQRFSGDPGENVVNSVDSDRIPKTPEKIQAREERSVGSSGMAVSKNASLERSTSRRKKQQGEAVLQGRTMQSAIGSFSAPISAKALALCRVMYQQAPPESALLTVRGAFLGGRPQMPHAVE